ncbi:MAG: mandelate racemase/muconate lactonizing enzyme family protein [Jatrophihabitans sp.]|uniref:mandelate racemase/muconate lactonizing enzyme family protein n=1 Tax=Jatrophihabitans sp. TaxID=1932789 RepID=UPI003F801075
MKIEAIDTFTGWGTWCNWLFVRVTTSDGSFGWGEGSLHGAVASVETAIHEVGADLIGRQLLHPHVHWQDLYQTWRWRGGCVLMTAIGALDIALWDLYGKSLGKPVYELLGGPFRTELPVYASHWLEGVTEPDAAHAGALEATSRGINGLKWNPFPPAALARNHQRTIRAGADMMAAIRDAVGPDVAVYVECSEAFSPRTALAAADAFRPHQPAWFEEPLPYENAAAMSRLRHDIGVPIALGERLLSRWEVEPLLRQHACDVLQPDVMHAGGLSEAMRIANLAETYYVPIAPHNPGGPVCLMASLHLAAAIPNFETFEEMEGERERRDSLLLDPPTFVDGKYALSDAPGLGVDLDLERALEMPARRQPRLGRRGVQWH